jgi:hypothetical protein
LQLPSLLLVAETTHCEQEVAEEQLAHPLEQAVQIPLLSQ